MIINIRHETIYSYDKLVPRLVQLLRLYPTKCKNQKILNWEITSNVGDIESSYEDSLGHRILNIYNDNFQGQQIIKAKGKVETKDLNGTIQGITEKVNPLCFLRLTDLTRPGKKIIELSKTIKKKNKDEIKFCHDLNLIVSEIINYKSGTTNNNTSAETALKKGKGVCQDFAHILISLARIFNMPARYINGYLIEDNNSNDYFTHAWTEIFIKDLGWVGFDPSHRRCVDDKYVRLSCGYDFIDASPIKGVRLNYLGSEELSYNLNLTITQ